MSDLTVTPVTVTDPADRLVLERLFPLFRHEMSAFSGELPGPDGAFRDGWLRSVLGADPDWAGYLFRLGERPAGFAFVRNIEGPGPVVLNSFFLVHAVRRRGHGLPAALDVLRRRPGDWEVAFQDANRAAVAFWPRVAQAAGGDGWRTEHRPAPRPGMAPNAWICFTVGAATV
ncbi:MAG TPA: GNAT family N-acetyltransferase [Actinospica sp.]|nr:GNAT family N-acetyltransferase [Actinospica sp.]